MSELLEGKVEMCPEACCGVPVTECSCGPDCKHCDCYAKNKMNEDQELSYDEVNQSIEGLSSQEQAEFERMINAWMQSRPDGVTVKRVNEIISFFNRAGRSSGKTPSEVLAMVSDFIAKNPGRGARVSEDATAGATSAGNIASVANPIAAHAKVKRDKNGVPKAAQRKKKDGTTVNGLDAPDNVFGGKAVRRTS